MSKFLKYSVVILPLIFLLAGLNMHKAKYANDPDYIYLLNAVAICDGKSVGHIDNPGTTVMQIAAATITIMHFVSNPENDTLVTHVLKNPDKYLEVIRTVLLVLNTIVLFLLGWLALVKLKSVIVALLLQTFTFISTNTLDHVWTKLSPEPVLFFVTCIYIIYILYFYSDKEKDSWKHVIIFAAITGVGLATKATFLPLVIFPLIILPSLKKKLFYLLGIFPSFFLCTIPAIPEYNNMFFWFRNLITHSGKYGSGEKVFVDLQTYFPNMIKIVEKNLIFGIVVGIALVLILISFARYFWKKKKINWELRILTGLIATSGFGILLVAKHYHANHYLIPVLLLTGVTFFFTLTIVLNNITSRLIKKYFSSFILISLILFIAWRQIPILIGINKAYKISNEEMDLTRAMIKNDYPEYTVVNYYTFSLNKYTALKFGDVYAGNKLLPYLKNIYPSTYFYDHSRRQILLWDDAVSLNDFMELHGDKILMINGPNNLKTVSEMKSIGLPLVNIYKGKHQTIYKLGALN